MSTKFNYSSIGKTVDGTTFCSGVETLAENIIEDSEEDSVIVFPSATGWASLRSSAYRMTTENAEAHLPLPIYKLKRVLIKVPKFKIGKSSANTDWGGPWYVTDLVNEELEAVGCPLKFQVQIDVAIDELFGNIARYAYKDGTGKATVRLEIEDDPACAVLTFVDQGIPFDPLDMPEPDTTLSLKERKIGGLGIFLVKKTMDDMAYQYKDGQNILRIKKKLR